jgi:hypothetical protein
LTRRVLGFIPWRAHAGLRTIPIEGAETWEATVRNSA